ncbi:MAG: hypothetical protein KF718_18060 [Polyangiaceae bacterium]|nr:hypothetical protein [Polyangiaceae bacterium]
MLLFQKRFHAGLVDGSIRLTFRRWERPRVRVGGRYRCHPIGVLRVDGVSQVVPARISEQDARAAGFTSRAELLRYLAGVSDQSLDGPVFRVELAYDGQNDRIDLALDDRVDDEAEAQIEAALARLDARRTWTEQTLALIAANPRVRAAELAARAGRDTASFKADVVKLKRLGLTQSFEVGYELSPRGRTYLARRRSAPGTSAGKQRRARR